MLLAVLALQGSGAVKGAFRGGHGWGMGGPGPTAEQGGCRCCCKVWEWGAAAPQM